MPNDAARNTSIRLLCFSLLWLAAFGVRLANRGDPRALTKFGLFVAALLLTVLLMWLVQRIARYRIPWLVELFAMPFVAGAFLYLAVLIRDFVQSGT